MKTLTLLAQKGGTGKTTLAVHLAVHTAQKGKRVVLLDLDPQKSAVTWNLRRQDDQPEIIAATAAKLAAAQKQAAKGGVDILVVDTAPHAGPAGRTAAAAADLTLVPSRPATFDLDAIGASVDIVKSVSAPASIVLNACPPPTRFGEAGIVREAREALIDYGLNICPVAIAQRAAMGHALIGGQAVTEFEPRGKAAGEVVSLWRWIEKEWT